MTLQSPTVTNVLVRSTGWASDFPFYGGYSIPVGSGAQLATLPWEGINQIEVVFSENVQVDQSDLLLTGVNVPSYNVSGGTFSYNPATFTATWTLPQSIGNDELMLALNAGGNVDFRFNVLPGDVNQDGAVNIGDLTLLAAQWNQSGQTGDLNGDGHVDIGDLTALASAWQTNLPSGSPAHRLVPGGCSVGSGHRRADRRQHFGIYIEPGEHDRRLCGR